MAAKKTTNTPAKKRGRPKRTKEAALKAIKENALDVIDASGLTLRQKKLLQFLIFGRPDVDKTENTVENHLEFLKVDPRIYYLEWMKHPKFIETKKVIDYMLFEKLNQKAIEMALDSDSNMLRYMLDKKGAILKEEGYTAVPIQVQTEPIKIEFHTPVPDRNIFTDDND